MGNASQDSSLAGYERLFSRIAPQLQSARKLENELNRQLAHRFNVFDYLDTLELGLSKLIADLLNPRAAHGQGALFLETFFHLFRPDLQDANLDFSRAQVTVEKLIPEQRRIDVFVRIPPEQKDLRIPSEQTDFCLAFENKPYAYDQKDQVNDYLKYLGDSYSSKFLLIYLSPRGEMPTESSVTSEYLKDWIDRFAVLPYVIDMNDDNSDLDSPTNEDTEDLFKSGSLVDWLAKCRQVCDVERLRLFLGDAERFCQTKFGHSRMSSDIEIQTLEKYLLEHTDLLDSAQSVFEAWPKIRRSIFKRFLEQVYNEIKQKYSDEGLELDWEFGERGKNSRIWLNRKSWKKNHNADSSFSKGRTSICLSSYHPNLTRWMVGVRSPKNESSMNESERDDRNSLEEALNGKVIGEHTNGWWPVFRNIQKDMTDWNEIVSRLNDECSKGGGDITDYYVKEFVDVVDKAIPIIDGIANLNEEE